MSKKALIWSSIVIFVLWAGSGFLITASTDKSGEFGDMFGAINALFSGFAFLGMIYAILLQRNELQLQREATKLQTDELNATRQEIILQRGEMSLQREEMVNTREELKGQKESMQLQNEFIQQQNFEGTFFQMLKLHNDLVSGMDIGKGDNRYTGKDVLMYIKDKHEVYFKPQVGIRSTEDHIKYCIQGYTAICKKFESDIGCYFRSLYNVFKMVEHSQVEDKKHYANIVRAQLSESELWVIFYNGIYGKDSKFVVLINKYALLKHIPKLLHNREDHLSFYDKSAYGGEYPEIA